MTGRGNFDRWHPAVGGYFSGLETGTCPPAAGTLLANDRTLWRVLAVHEKNPANWDDSDHRRMARDVEYRDHIRGSGSAGPAGVTPGRHRRELLDWDGQPETWPSRPRAVEMRPEAGGERRHLRWPHRGWAWWFPTDEHHPVCASCGELFPCREIDGARVAAREMAAVEKLMSVPPGCCWHCHQPITRRQKAVEFPGDNLLLPGAPSPAFHTRTTGGCYDAAAGYRKRWQAANPDTPSPTSLFDHLDKP